MIYRLVQDLPYRDDPPEASMERLYDSWDSSLCSAILDSMLVYLTATGCA